MEQKNPLCSREERERIKGQLAVFKADFCHPPSVFSLRLKSLFTAYIRLYSLLMFGDIHRLDHILGKIHKAVDEVYRMVVGMSTDELLADGDDFRRKIYFCLTSEWEDEAEKLKREKEGDTEGEIEKLKEKARERAEWFLKNSQIYYQLLDHPKVGEVLSLLRIPVSLIAVSEKGWTTLLSDEIRVKNILGVGGAMISGRKLAEMIDKAVSEAPEGTLSITMMFSPGEQGATILLRKEGEKARILTTGGRLVDRENMEGLSRWFPESTIRVMFFVAINTSETLVLSEEEKKQIEELGFPGEFT